MVWILLYSNFLLLNTTFLSADWIGILTITRTTVTCNIMCSYCILMPYYSYWFFIPVHCLLIQCKLYGLLLVMMTKLQCIKVSSFNYCCCYLLYLFYLLSWVLYYFIGRGFTTAEKYSEFDTKPYIRESKFITFILVKNTVKNTAQKYIKFPRV